MTTHHPAPELLLDHAAGTLPEALSLLVATHATMCCDCAAELLRLQELGGLLLDQSAALDASDCAESLAAVLARLDEPAPPLPAFDEETLAIVPQPLRPYLGRSLGDLPWHSVGWLSQEFCLPLASRSMHACLMRSPAGTEVPEHVHHGHEYAVVLSGGYRDAHGIYLRSDFAVKSPTETHQPVVDEHAECIALVVFDGPVEFTGSDGSVFNPLLRD